MEATGLAIILGAIGTMAAGLAAAFVVIYNAIKANERLQSSKLQEIHVLVNSRLSEALARIEALTSQLESRGITPSAEKGVVSKD